MAITTEAGLQTATQNGRRVRFYKGGAVAAANGYFTTWRLAGLPGAAGSPTTTGAQLTRTSTGALPIPAASATSYIAEWEGAALFTQTFLLCDRLVEFAGLSGTVTTAQTVSALALPSRATGATDVELWLEIHTAIGSTASPTVTASYTNQSGTSGRTATLVGGIPASGGAVHRCYPFALQAGDTGVQSVQSVTSTTSTTTAGNMGLTLRRTLLMGMVPYVGGSFSFGWAECDLQRCPDDAALEIVSATTGGTYGNLTGAIRVAQG